MEPASPHSDFCGGALSARWHWQNTMVPASDRAEDARGLRLAASALEMGKPKRFQPANLAIPPPAPELDGRALQIGGIQCEPNRDRHHNPVRPNEEFVRCPQSAESPTSPQW
jgi:hypothetical protein